MRVFCNWNVTEGIHQIRVSLLTVTSSSTGYATHMIGKWHLGYHKWEYTPTYRGFDTFYGFYNGWGDHYSHEIDNILDLRDNKEAVRDLNGTFAAFAFSKVMIMLFEFIGIIVFSISIEATACP